MIHLIINSQVYYQFFSKAIRYTYASVSVAPAHESFEWPLADTPDVLVSAPHSASQPDNHVVCVLICMFKDCSSKQLQYLQHPVPLASVPESTVPATCLSLRLMRSQSDVPLAAAPPSTTLSDSPGTLVLATVLETDGSAYDDLL